MSAPMRRRVRPCFISSTCRRFPGPLPTGPQLLHRGRRDQRCVAACRHPGQPGRRGELRPRHHDRRAGHDRYRARCAAGGNNPALGPRVDARCRACRRSDGPAERDGRCGARRAPTSPPSATRSSSSRRPRALGDKRFRLADLLRGRRGSEAAVERTRRRRAFRDARRPRRRDRDPRRGARRAVDRQGRWTGRERRGARRSDDRSARGQRCGHSRRRP